LLSLSKPSDALRAFTAPILCWSPRSRLLGGTVAIAICLLRAVYLVLHNESVWVMADAPYYLGIAREDYSQIIQPFASRQLGALVVAALVHTLHWTVERAFVVEGVVSLVFMLVAVYYLVLQTKAPPWILLAIALVPFWGTLLQYLVLPDLWFSALLAALLLLIAKEHLLLASLMMFPLMLSRESTSLTLVCFLIAAWGSLRWRDRIVAVASAIAGAAVVSHLAARAHSNVEHLPQAVYMLAKVPWNFLHNILGIVPWSNVYPTLCAVPAWSTPLHFGSVRSIGVCGFSAHSWELIAQAILTNFGLLPLLVACLWQRRQRSATRSVLLNFTLLYGGVSLFLAPLLGIWFVHLIGYAWPLFLIALPLLFGELTQAPTSGNRAIAAVAFLCVHVAVCWVSYRWMWIPQIAIEAVLWIVGFFLIRHWLSNSEGRFESSPLIAA
jgi:hypothetical protein